MNRLSVLATVAVLLLLFTVPTPAEPIWPTRVLDSGGVVNPSLVLERDNLYAVFADTTPACPPDVEAIWDGRLLCVIQDTRFTSWVVVKVDMSGVQIPHIKISGGAVPSCGNLYVVPLTVFSAPIPPDPPVPFPTPAWIQLEEGICGVGIGRDQSAEWFCDFNVELSTRLLLVREEVDQMQPLLNAVAVLDDVPPPEPQFLSGPGMVAPVGNYYLCPDSKPDCTIGDVLPECDDYRECESNDDCPEGMACVEYKKGLPDGTTWCYATTCWSPH